MLTWDLIKKTDENSASKFFNFNENVIITELLSSVLGTIQKTAVINDETVLLGEIGGKE